MSFNVAVWEGARPKTDALARVEFQRLYATYADGAGSTKSPSAAVRRFVATITAAYPDAASLAPDRADGSVWSDGRLLGNAAGPFVYFGILWTFVEEVVPFVMECAREQGLVCFDAQERALLR
jgi:hypothetical protein